MSGEVSAPKRASNGPSDLVALKKSGPNLDRLSVIDEDGHRKKVYPALHSGFFTFHRQWSRWVLLAFGFALPWLQLNGRQAVLLDIPGRQFHFLWLHLNAQDVPLFFFALTGVGFVLFVTSALFGRVFCGWTCPHTVVLEGLFRPIEKLIEGAGNVAIRFDQAPWTPKKIAKKALKWTLFFLLAFVLAHTFLAYFVGGRRLITWLTVNPKEHWTVFLWASAATGIMLFNFGWFREQLCLIICPYGRLQSALQDDDTVVVGYDPVRGEPRGKAKAADVGACVDCKRCVTVCPTGIDIRNGLQMECIGCAACIDACDEIMDKLDRPRGLIRYDSQAGLTGQAKRFLRPRLAYYAVAGILGLGVAATLVGSRTETEANVVRVQGAPYELVDGKVFNRAMVHVVNKADASRTLELSAPVRPGFNIVLPVKTVTISPLANVRLPIVVSANSDVAINASVELLLSEDGAVVKTLRFPFLSPGAKKRPDVGTVKIEEAKDVAN